MSPAAASQASPAIVEKGALSPLSFEIIDGAFRLSDLTDGLHAVSKGLTNGTDDDVDELEAA